MSQKNSANKKTITGQRNATLPAYHRLYVILAENIKNSVYTPGMLLPSENVLTQTYDVSRVTVRRALDQLVEDGLVKKHKGQGTIVTLAGSAKNKSRITGLLSNLVSQGLEFSNKTLFWDVVTPTQWVAQKLDLTAGSECYLIRRIRYLDDAPISHASIYLPQEIGAEIIANAGSDLFVLDLLEETSNPVIDMTFDMSATLADGEVAELLDLATGSPILRMQGLGYDAQQRPIYFQDSRYHPDRYEYRVNLVRDDSSGKMVWRHRG